MKYLKIAVCVVMLLIIDNTLFAQNKWAVEFRPGLNFVTQDIGDAKLKTGFGFEVAVSYKVIQYLDVYVGWGWNTFATKNSNSFNKSDFDETGYTFGLQFVRPVKTGSKLSYLIRAGGIYNHIEIENNDGDVVQDSGHGLGYEIGVGVDYNFAEDWSLRPQIGYRALSRDIKIFNTATKVDLNYVAFGLGLVKTF